LNGSFFFFLVGFSFVVEFAGWRDFGSTVISDGRSDNLDPIFVSRLDLDSIFASRIDRKVRVRPEMGRRVIARFGFDLINLINKLLI
jgi:hypothetical protein